MTEKETKNKLEELKDRKIDEETLDEIAGGASIEIVRASSGSKGDAKRTPGGMSKKVKIK